MSTAHGGAPPRTRWSPWVTLVTRVELAIAAAALTTMFVLVLIQAAQRYLPVEGWAWTGELARFCLVWLTFTIGVFVGMTMVVGIPSLRAW